VKALLFERKVARFAAANVAGRFAPGRGAKVGPLRLANDVDEPLVSRPGWVRVRPRLAGICGSDLATIDGRSSRYFEPIVSFPFVPGHEIVGELDDGTRVVVEPVLNCEARDVAPMCDACAAGRNGNCERIAFGHLEPGLQTGFCADTGGGWGLSLTAHESQLHVVPDDLPDEAAVLVEPTACAVHAVETSGVQDGDVVVVLGAGTLGLLTVAALHAAAATTIIAVAKHPEQRTLARDLGAQIVVAPDEVRRAVRRQTRSLENGDVLTGGADLVFDCVGSGDSLADSLAVTRPKGRVSLVGMAGTTTLDLTPLWHKELALVGAYAYRHETFAAAFDLVRTARLERLLSATYPLDRFTDAIEHAANAGSRGAVKIAFDLRNERNR
jgi:threonine dehydrogenase-like Zn-dependent dehydrogenase